MKEKEETKMVNIEKILEESEFTEYPPHDFPFGIFRIRTSYRHVYYHPRGDFDLDWALFNNSHDVSDLRLYRLRAEKMKEIIEQNEQYDKRNAFLTFDSIGPDLTGEKAYESLQTNYPSPYWIGIHVAISLYEELKAQNFKIKSTKQKPNKTI